VVAAAHVDFGIVGKRFAGLVDAALAGIDEARQDQRLRALPARGEPTLDEQLIGAALGDQARAGCSATSRPSAASAVATMCFAVRPAVSYCAFGES